MQAIIVMRTKIGFSNEFIQAILEPAEKGYNKLIKLAIIKLVKTLLIDYQPYTNWIKDQPINVYIWGTIASYQPYQTIYQWEKSKYGDQKGGGAGISEEDCDKMLKFLRQIMIEHVETETED